VTERDQIQGTGGEDAAVESTVLRQVLILHPAQVTLEELIREIAADPDAFAERDAIERAVRDLAHAGLLHRHGEFVIPSRASLRFSELLGGP
jgi:hypothetical protein